MRTVYEVKVKDVVINAATDTDPIRYAANRLGFKVEAFKGSYILHWLKRTYLSIPEFIHYMNGHIKKIKGSRPFVVPSFNGTAVVSSASVYDKDYFLEIGAGIIYIHVKQKKVK